MVRQFMSLYIPYTPAVPTNGDFTDVKPSDYFADAVKWAVENNVTSGTGGGKFSPTPLVLAGRLSLSCGVLTASRSLPPQQTPLQT